MATGWQPGAPRPLSDEDKGQWDKRLEQAGRFAKPFHEAWAESLKKYAEPKGADVSRYDVNALLPFRHVESKKAQLFYQTPDVQLLPIDPQINGLPVEQILPLRQKVLNHKLGADGVHVKREIHATLFDALAASGFLVLKIGYENRTVRVQTVQPGLLGTPAETVTVDVPVWERCFLSRVPPKRLLVPDEFHGTNFDEAPWLGVRGTMPLSTAKRQPGWTIPEDFQHTVTKDDTVFDHGLDGAGDGERKIEYTEVWYRAALYDESVVHPELYRCLVLVKGLERPAKHVDSPYQTIGPDGRLTDDSLIGNPIHVGTLRDLSDSAYVPSDLAVGEQLVNELNKFRTQAVRGRSRRQPIVLFDTGGMDQSTVDKIEANQGPVGLPAGTLAGGVDKLIAVVNPGTEPRDNYTAQDYIERDWEKALGVAANQAGAPTKSKRTATEARIVQGNADARYEAERDRLREYFVGAVRKFDVMLQRFMGRQELVKILGQDGAMLWESWRALPGKYAYKIMPDSGIHVDAAQYRAQKLDEYNLFRKDDRVNTDELLKAVARALGYDPAKFVAPPSDKTAEPPKSSLSFSAVDLLSKPSGLLILDLLANGGIKLSDQTIQAIAAAHAAQSLLEQTAAPGTVGANVPPGHGGSANRTEPVNQHQTERTGALQGVGKTAA